MTKGDNVNKTESKYLNTAIKMDKALISLLEKKSIEYITVREICEVAQVNRSTFYLHYENIGDLIEETTRYLLDDFLTRFVKDAQTITFNPKNCEINELLFIKDEFLFPFLMYIKEHKGVFDTVLSNLMVLGMNDVYSRMFEEIFNPILDRFGYKSSERTYVILYYLNGITAVIKEWLKNDCDKTIDEIIEVIYTCVFGLEGKILRLNPEEFNKKLL